MSGNGGQDGAGKDTICICNSLVLNKGLMYEGVLTFVVPVGQHHTMLNGVHHDAAIRASREPWLLLKKDFGGP